MCESIKPRAIFTIVIFFYCQSYIIPQSEPKSLLFRTETKDIHSEIIDQLFEIKIALPADYCRNDSVYYPAVYCTDGNRNFNLVSNIVEILTFPKEVIPSAIVVGIGYKMNGLEDWAAWRNRDLLPTNDSTLDRNWEKQLRNLSGRNDIVSKSGGAGKFLEFIISELIPFIESNYRVNNNDRTLLGYSYGGLFTLFAMFEHPDIFQRYYAGSPSLNWDNKVIFQLEKEYAETHKNLPANIFISIGSLENPAAIENINTMADILRSRNYKSLKLETHIFEDETHSSCYAAGICRALIFINK